MFFADHGRPMPWGKQWLSVEGLQVPLIIRGPKIDANSVEERLVSLIDLAPSMLQLAGLPMPVWMEGRAILVATFPERPSALRRTRPLWRRDGPHPRGDQPGFAVRAKLPALAFTPQLVRLQGGQLSRHAAGK
jgi:arylsulfatase A-like enzyme